MHAIVESAFADIDAITSETGQRYWDLFDVIWTRVRDNMPPELDEAETLTLLVQRAHETGHGDNLWD